MNIISNNLFSSILKSFNISSCLLDKDVVILDCDQGFFELFMYDKESLVNQSLSILFENDDKYQNWFQKYLLPFYNAKNLSNSSSYVTFFSSSKEQSVYQFTLHKAEDNKILLSILDSQNNVKEEILALEKTKQYYLKASMKKTQYIKQRDSVIVNQAKLAAMGEMIGAIAHQWKQPLSKINSILVDIQRLFTTNTKQNVLESRLDDIEELTLHMADTIEDFRTYISPEKEKTLFSFSEVIRDSQKILSSTISLNKINFDINLLDDISIYGYKKEFIQSLLIFFNNSKDAFILNKVAHRYIKITTREINKNKIIRIEDNAGGIDNQILPNVFEPYFSTKKGQGGTGLGLYMAKLLIEDSMNGKLKIDSVDNRTEISIIILGLKDDQ